MVPSQAHHRVETDGAVKVSELDLSCNIPSAQYMQGTRHWCVPSRAQSTEYGVRGTVRKYRLPQPVAPAKLKFQGLPLALGGRKALSKCGKCDILHASNNSIVLIVSCVLTLGKIR